MADLASVTAGLIEKIQIGSSGVSHSLASTAYGECNTPAATQVKVVNMTGFQLVKGVTIHVKFTYNNTSASAPQLNVNGTGAKNIKLYGSTDAGTADDTTGWQAGAVIAFTYDGTYWVRDQGYNTNTQNAGTVTSVQVQASSPLTSTVNTAQSTSLNTTIKFANQDPSKVLAGPSSGTSAAAPTFRALVAADIPNLNASKITDGTLSVERGGTGASTLSSGQVLIGNGTSAVTTKAIDTTVTANSDNLITSGAVSTAISNITGAMHFIGSTSTNLNTDTTASTLTPKTTGSLTKTTGFTAGDVVLYGDGEYVWTGSAWEILGDQGSYALKSNTETVIKTATFTQNTLPSLTVTSTSIPNVTSVGTAPSLTITSKSIPNVTSVGSITNAEVNDGTLLITLGSTPTLGTAISVGSASDWNAGSAATLGTAISVGSASNWSAGTQASLSTTNATVVKP